MSSATLRSATYIKAWRPDRKPDPPGDHGGEFLTALFSGGDSRMAADPLTGLNKYLCPEVPSPDLTSVSSCTASPISPQAFERANAAFLQITHAQSARQRAHQLMALHEAIKARVLQYFGADELAHVILCPSGTDAMLTTALLLAAERPGMARTAILPSASETGTGVPMAAMCRMFDGPDAGRPVADGPATTVEIPLRTADGLPRSEEAVDDAFAVATKAATGNVVVYLTHGTKTGLIAPVSPPRGVDVIVDACQGRIAPETVAAYLGQGWPVVVTGSKFFGGPAFSGAVLFPQARLRANARSMAQSVSGDLASLGTALRWTAALATVDAFEPRAAEMAGILARRATTVERALAANPRLVPIGGLRPNGPGWADQPSVFTFAVRDPIDRTRLLSTAELRPIYEQLAGLRVLLGQPVSLGSFGGLRVAIGAQDLLDQGGDGRLAGAFATLARVVSPLDHIGGGRKPA